MSLATVLPRATVQTTNVTVVSTRNSVYVVSVTDGDRFGTLVCLKGTFAGDLMQFDRLNSDAPQVGERMLFSIVDEGHYSRGPLISTPVLTIQSTSV